MALPDYPITREEQYLSRIAGEDHPIPDYPITREEQYLAAIAEGGGGGAVSSVNGKTGDVVLVPSDLGASTKAMVVTYDDDTTETFNVLIQSE